MSKSGIEDDGDSKNDNNGINKEGGIDIINNNEGFLIIGVTRLSDEEVALSQLVYDMTVEELGQAINFIVRDNPQVISYTVFNSPTKQKENTPLLNRMN